MRIAVVHPYPVHRRGVGGVTRLDAMVRHLAARHEVTVLAHASGDPEADAAAVRDLAEAGVAQRLFPLPARTAAARLRWMAEGTPYFVGFNRNPALEAALAALAARGLDVVHAEFAYMYPAAAAAPGAVRALAEQETMSLAIERIGLVPRRDRSLFEHYLRADARRIRAFERRALASFHLRYAITPVEAAYLRALAGGEVGVVPHVVDPRRFVPPPAGRAPREPVALFVGSYRHRPNLHGIHWLAEHAWPLVRRAVPDARLDVVGPNMPEADRWRLAGVPGVRVVGWVDDLLARYHAAAVFVNPILSGGGMRGKVLEAFACGRAVVSTRMGLEGIEARDGEHCLIADDPAAFAAAAARLLVDAPLRDALGARARALVERAHDPRVVFGRLEDDYAAAVAARRWEIA